MRRPTILVSGEPRKCPEPETVGDFMMGGANCLRRPPISVRGGAQSLRTKRFSSGGAQSLRRPPILVTAEHSKCPEPETVGDFMMGVQSA